MTPQQIFGNWLATRLLKLFYDVKFTDLGPFRAIKFTSLLELDMQDKTYGWTVEMQLKAAKEKDEMCGGPCSIPEANWVFKNFRNPEGNYSGRL